MGNELIDAEHCRAILGVLAHSRLLQHAHGAAHMTSLKAHNAAHWRGLAPTRTIIYADYGDKIVLRATRFLRAGDVPGEPEG